MSKTIIFFLLSCLVLPAALLFCQQLRADDNGLVGHWTFDNAEAIGTDTSARKNDGKPGAEAERAKGAFGSALLLNGDAAHVIEVPDSESLHFGASDFSVEYWICPHTSTIDQKDKRRRILSKNAGTKSFWVIDLLGSGKLQLELADDAGKSASTFSEGAISDNTWTHLALVLDRKNMKVKFYLNGNLDATRELNPELKGKLDAPGAPLMIGGAWQLFNGMLDDLQLYNRALSDAEIKDAFENGKAARTSVRYEKRVELSAEFATKATYAVFNPHEAVELRLKVTGDHVKDDRVSWTMKDFRGKSVSQGTIDVPAGDQDWEGKLTLTDNGAGYFEVHLKLEANGTTIPRQGSKPPGFMAFAVLPEIEPLSLAHPDDSRFGICGSSSVESGKTSEGDPFSPLYQLVGAKWLYDNDGEPWTTLPAWLEKTGPNQYSPNLDPASHVTKKTYAMKNNLSVIFDLHSVPPWLMNMPAGKTIPPDKIVPAHNCQDYPPKDWEYYGNLLARFASEKTVRHAACFPNMRRSYYQIHWEPDWYWKGSDEEFVRMYETAAGAIKKADQGAFLLGPNYGVLAAGNKNLERLFSKGLGKYLDGIVIHSYFLAPNGENGTAPEEGGLVGDARRLMAMVHEFLPPGAPVINTEGSSRINGVDPAATPWVLRRQAAWFLRNHLICLGEGFTSTWFFLLGDNDVYSGYGMLYNLRIPQHPYNSPQLAPKPVFSATAAATRLLEGTKAICPLEYLGENVLGYCFDRNGQNLVALWSTDDKEREISLPVGTKRLAIYDPMGNKSDLQPTDGMARVKIDGNPVYLLGVAKEALPADANVTGYAGMNIVLTKECPAIPNASYFLFQGGSKLPAAQDGPAPVVPATAQPGTWLLQCVAAGELKGSWLVTVKPPVDIQPTCARILDNSIDLTIENKMDVEMSGQLQIRDKELDKDVGAITLKAGEKRNMRIDLAGLNLASPTRRLISVEFEDQNKIVSKSPAMECAMTSAAQASSAPIIDGDLDDWSKIPFHAVRGEDAVVIKNPEAPLRGDDDLSFSFAWQYDEKALYLALKVRDQSHRQTRPSGDSWQEDSVQLGLAADWNGTKWNVWQKLCVGLGKDGAPMVRRNSGSPLSSEDVPPTSIPCAIKRIDGETCYELAFPWSVIDPKLTGIPSQGKLGVGIMVNDVDASTAAQRGKNAAGSQQAETDVTASTIAANPKRKAMEAYGGMFWGKPEGFGVLLLNTLSER